LKDRNLWLVYSSTAVLGMAYGLAISVLSLYLDQWRYTEPEIGTMAAVFALGIALASLPAGWLVKRYSAKTVLVVSFLGYAGVVATIPLTVDSFVLLAGARFFDGVFSAGVWIASETVLLRRSSKHHKALVMSVYGIAMALGYGLGPLISKFLVAAGPLQLSFVVAAGFAAAGGVLLWARLDPDHKGAAHDDDAQGDDPDAAPTKTGQGDEIGWWQLLVKVRCSGAAAFCYGYLSSALVLFVPLYLARDHGFADGDVVVVPGFYAAGMVLFAPVAGYLGDRFGELLVMRRLALLGIGILVSFPFVSHFWVIMLMIAGAGAVFTPQLPLAIALQGLIVKPDEYPRANALYNALYAIGMLLGPPLTGVVYASGGAGVMMFHLAAFWVAFVAFAWVYRRDDPAVSRVLRGVSDPA